MAKAKSAEMPLFVSAEEAIADAWASIDGRQTAFRRGRTAKSSMAFGGHYAGYMAEAAELRRRLLRRGYKIVQRIEGRDG